ncbi:hypothetical protein ACSLNT_30300, partial [Escherichia coli]
MSSGSIQKTAATFESFLCATTILWTLFALFIFLFAMDLLTGYYWQSEARSRLQFYFLLAV